MRRNKIKKIQEQRVLAEEQREYEMREYLLADCFLFENSLKILHRRLPLANDVKNKKETERKIQEIQKKKENRIKYLTLLEPIFELSELLEKEDLSGQERAYFTQRRDLLRANLKNDRLYTLIWEYHEKLNGR
jgi:hypothetical protein